MDPWPPEKHLDTRPVAVLWLYARYVWLAVMVIKILTQHQSGWIPTQAVFQQQADLQRGWVMEAKPWL